jgi:hypothetical protein
MFSADGLAERWNRAMLLGDFEKAWEETDKIEVARRQGAKLEGHLVWDGTDFTDETVLLRCNHGLGDAIQFIRYAPLLRQKCSRLIVKAKPILVPLLQTIPFVDGTISRDEADPDFEVEIECMELPYAFRTTLNTIPNRVPYIPLKNSGEVGCQQDELTIGLCWASGPWNSRRSVRFEDLCPLMDLQGISCRSLQWGEAASDGPWPPIQEDLIETALTICEVDLVITVDTMVAHLAGALGKPVWFC